MGDEDISSCSTAAKSGWCWGEVICRTCTRSSSILSSPSSSSVLLLPCNKTRQTSSLCWTLCCSWMHLSNRRHCSSCRGGDRWWNNLWNWTSIGGTANGTAAAISGGADGAGSAVGGTAEGVGVGVGGIASETGHQLGDAVTGAGAAIGGAPRIGARLCYSGLYYYYC